MIKITGETIDSSVGTTVKKGERNDRNDSDFYAAYYSVEQDKFTSVDYATTRGGCDNSIAEVDASENIQALYSLCTKLDRAKYLYEKSMSDCKKIRVGSVCDVVKGRKIPKGAKVKVLRIKESGYGGKSVLTDYYNIWTNIDNLQFNDIGTHFDRDCLIADVTSKQYRVTQLENEIERLTETIQETKKDALCKCGNITNTGL